jgi:subtilase family serine protease
MRAAYYGNGPLTGAGQSIGIFSFDGYLASDVQLYYAKTGMSSNVPIKNVLVDGFSGACTSVASPTGSSCDDGEQVLDIVNAIGMAPGILQILFYEGSSNTEILNQMATDNIAKVLSSSWGWNPADAASDDPIFQEFAAQGQTFVSASGDDGEFNASTYSFPGVDQYITQVGGTVLTTSGAGGTWSAETAWPQSGGGYYSGTSIPSWQQLAGVINAANLGSTTLRNSPDVAAEANFDNPTVINGAFTTGYGGTSFATPRWAGFLALVNQQSVANGNGTVGFINPALYKLALSANYSAALHDISSGSNPPSTGGGTGFSAVPGYDLVTGWGSPAGAALIDQLAGSSANHEATGSH